MEKLSIFKDSFWTVISQAISMLAGVVMSLILPKFMTVEDFGFWQLFLLYASYVGLLHLGAGDGIYLNLGGKYFNTINKTELYPQIQLISFLQVFFALLCAIFSFLWFRDDYTRLFVFLSLSVYIVIENTYKILCFVLMATDKMVFNSKSVILDKIMMLISITVLLLFLKKANALYVVSAYVFSHFLVLLVVITKFKGILCFTSVFSHKNLRSVVCLSSIGIVLTFSNIMSTFIVGSCRMLVERFWDIRIFAQLSLSITVTVFILTFVSQISYVLFPYLRRTTEENQSKILRDSTFVLTIISPYLYFLFFLLYYFLKMWLPQYDIAAHFVMLIAPICFYEMRISLLFNTYFKNLNKIKPLLYINVITVFGAVILYALSVYIHNIDMMAFSIVFSVLLKNVIMMKYLYKHYSLQFDVVYLFDLLFMIIQPLVFLLFSIKVSFVLYIIMICLFGIYLYIFKKNTVFQIVRNFKL